jgi:hypothetical protein
VTQLRKLLPLLQVEVEQVLLRLALQLQHLHRLRHPGLILEPVSLWWLLKILLRNYYVRSVPAMNTILKTAMSM